MQPDRIPEDFAAFRLYKARECLQDAQKDLSIASFKSAANRSYYCIFHAMRAILALDRFDSKRHSGVIDYFRKNYIRTELFSKDFSKIIGNAFELRNESDYVDFYLVSKKEVAAQVENAKTLLDAVEKYIESRVGPIKPYEPPTDDSE
jgi:uncharacterized protein (UPF0332 family)